MQHNDLPPKTYIKKCSANLNNLGPIINKCLFSKDDLLAILPANLVVGELQIISAVEKAYESFFSGRPFSSSFSMEFLLYFFATAKINKALGNLADVSRTKHFFVVTASKDAHRAIKSMRCVLSSGFKTTDFKHRPCVKKLRALYGVKSLGTYSLHSHRKALELAIIEKQAMLMLGK